MGLENINQDSKPDELDPNWPLGSDDIKYGDNHVRNIKVVVKNAWTAFTSFRDKINGYFNSEGKALKAVEADSLGGFDKDDYALKDGDYSELRARATTKADVGLSRVENWYPSTGLTDDSSVHYARAVDTYNLKKGLDSVNSRVSSLASLHAVGSFIFATYWIGDNGTYVNPGTNIAGSNLRAAGMGVRDYDQSSQSPAKLLVHGTALPGTWRCLGYTRQYYRSSNYKEKYATLWVRVL